MSERITGVAEIVRPNRALRVIEEDPDDDRVLECAVEGEPDFIVTGDRHLLKLGIYRGCEILTAARFVENALPRIQWPAMA